MEIFEKKIYILINYMLDIYAILRAINIFLYLCSRY